MTMKNKDQTRDGYKTPSDIMNHVRSLNRSRMDQYIKNGSRMDQEWIKNGPRMDQECINIRQMYQEWITNGPKYQEWINNGPMYQEWI